MNDYVKNWHSVIFKCGKILESEYKTGLSIVAPFGFELLENETWSSRVIRRHYVYIGSRDRISNARSKVIQDKCLRMIYMSIRELYPGEFCNSVALKTSFGDVYSRDAPGGEKKSISSEIRVCDDIYYEYALYIVWSIFAINSRTLSEFQSIRNSRRARQRILQLHILHRHLCLAEMSKNNYEKIRDCIIEPENEKQLLQFDLLCNSVVKHENEQIVDKLTHGCSRKYLGVGIHSEFGISFEANSSKIELVVNRIVSKYRNIGSFNGGGL